MDDLYVSGDPTRVLPVPLHSAIPPEQQQVAFLPPPAGMRKVVLSTNVAETSVTIPDVVYVVNLAQACVKRYDALNRLVTLRPEWVSQASMKQRAGRAGSVQRGVCYHLFPRTMLPTFDAMTLPELMRTPLEDVCLQIKYLGLGNPRAFLPKALDPPDDRTVVHAIEVLQDLGALQTLDNSSAVAGPGSTPTPPGPSSTVSDLATPDAPGCPLSTLGRQLAQLPVPASAGRMLIVAAVLGCLDPVLTLAATDFGRLPFLDVTGLDKAAATAVKKRRTETAGAEVHSEHSVLAAIHAKWKAAGHRADQIALCQDLMLSHSGLQRIHLQRRRLMQTLASSGLLGDQTEAWGPRSGGFHGGAPGHLSWGKSQRLIESRSRNAGEHHLVRAVLVAGLVSSTARLQQWRRPETFKARIGAVTLQDGAAALGTHGLVSYLQLTRVAPEPFSSFKVSYNELPIIVAVTAVTNLLIVLMGPVAEPLEEDGSVSFKTLSQKNGSTRFVFESSDKVQLRLRRHIDDVVQQALLGSDVWADGQRLGQVLATLEADEVEKKPPNRRSRRRDAAASGS